MPKATKDYTSRGYFERITGRPATDREYNKFLNDTGKKGWTLPFYNYEGPGNSLQSGEPINSNDAYAQVHDTQYFDTKYRYDEGEITREQAESEVLREDMDAIGGFIKGIPEEPIGGYLGAAGLLLKDGFEWAFGTQYPDFSEELASDKPMEGEKTPTKGKRPHTGQDQPHSSKVAKEAQPSTSRGIPPHHTGHDQPHTIREPAIADTPTKGGSIVRAHPEGSSRVGPASADNVNLPADADMGLTGTGKEQASGGASSEGTPLYQTIKPYTDFGQKTTTYTKSHKFMTFGLAPTILSLDANGARCLTSGLAELPWHIPALYLNQSEFDLLPEGAHCVSMNIEVFYRGSTIQFETAATATGLATLK